MVNYSLLYHPEYYQKSFEIKHFSDRELSFTLYQNATVLPAKHLGGLTTGGGVITASGEYLGNTALHDGSGSVYPYDDSEIQDSKAIYLGMFTKTWGHCLTDNLRRLWFLNTEVYREKYADWKLVYIPYPNFTFSESFQELLKILGFDYARFEPIQRVTGFEKILIPDESFYTSGGPRFFTKEYKAMIDVVRDYAIRNKRTTENDKFYFTYAGYKKSKQTGEEKLESFFRSRDYSVIVPGQSFFLCDS